MLIIRAPSNNPKGVEDIIWHVGKIPPVIKSPIVSVQADGGELEFITEHAPELVQGDEPVQVFFGGDANRVMWCIRRS